MEHDTVRACSGLRSSLQPSKVVEPIVRLVRDYGWGDRVADRLEVHVIYVGRCEDDRAGREGAQKLGT